MKLSIVIPTWNYGRYLKECLNSVYNQTFKDFEVLVVDGGSNDCTLEVLSQYPKVKVAFDVPPQGPVKAVNKGIAAMQGEYFTQLNADCVLYPRMYEQTVRKLEANKRLGMVYTRWQIIDDNGKHLGYSRQPDKFNRNKLLHGNYIDASSMVIRKSCFNVVGVFEPQFPWSMDWVMAVKIASKFPVAFINEPLFKYRVHPGQITEEKSKKEQSKVQKFIRQFYSRTETSNADFVRAIKLLGRAILK